MANGCKKSFVLLRRELADSIRAEVENDSFKAEYMTATYLYVGNSKNLLQTGACPYMAIISLRP